MFTPEEEDLFSGSTEALERFFDEDRALIVDWKAGEEDVLATAAEFLPPGALVHRVEANGAGQVQVTVGFAGRERSLLLPANRALNAFHAVGILADVLTPEWEVRLFRATAGDDTIGFLVRPAAWWAALRVEHPGVGEAMFDDLATFRAATGPVVFPPVDDPHAPRPPVKKRWWKRG